MARARGPRAPGATRGSAPRPRRTGASLLLLIAGLGACAREPAAPASASSTSTAPPASTAPASASPGSAPASAPAGSTGALPDAPALRYLALGDSFTIGTGSGEEASFPARLAARLRARGAAVTLSNLGVNGYRTEELLAREAPEIARFRPSLVTLAIGANDLVNGSSPEHYRAQVRRILAALDAAGVPHGRVLVLPQPDWSRSPAAASFGAPAEIQAGIERFNGILREEALGFGARWVPLWALMQRQALLGLVAGDGLHPSATAYEGWAAGIEEALPAEVLGGRGGR